MKIYLAGPDVFLHDAVEIGQRKVQLCARHGLTGLYPLDNAIDLTARDASLRIFRGNETMMIAIMASAAIIMVSARDASLRIFRGNEPMMIAADAIIANLTPFRGPG